MDYEEVSGQRYSGGLGHQTAPISHRSTAVCCVPELQTRVQEDFTIMEKIRYYLDTIKQQGDLYIIYANQTPCVFVSQFYVYLIIVVYSVLIVQASLNQMKAPVGAFPVIVKFSRSFVCSSSAVYTSL